MKKIILLAFFVTLCLACNEKRYSQQSPEIETYKKTVEAYKVLDWENFETHYADTVTIANNVPKDQGMSIDQVIAKNIEDATLFSWDIENEEYEMVVTDDGETWVNFWGLWKGTMKSNNKTYEIPIHNTARFINGKIAEEYGYWNALDLDANNVEVIDNLYKAFSSGDIPKVLEMMDANVVWNEAESNAYADGNPYLGPEAVLDGVFTRVGADHEYFNLQDIDLHSMSNNMVLATLRYDAKIKNGKAFNAQVAHLWTLKNGKITAFQQYVDTKKLADSKK
jgi:ketosteroid isomerase-like protein